MAEPEKAREELALALQRYPASNDGREQLAELDFSSIATRKPKTDFACCCRPTTAGEFPAFSRLKSRKAGFKPQSNWPRDQVRRSPARGDIRLALAETWCGRQVPGGGGAISKIARKNPKSALFYLKMGEAKLQRRRLPGALAAFQTARQLTPGDARAALDLALLYDRTRRSEQARKEYEIVIQLQPENATALNNLAYLEAEQGVDLDQALAQAQRAQQKLPAISTSGHACAGLYPQESYQRGIRMLRDLVSRKPDSAPFHLHLALAFIRRATGRRPGGNWRAPGVTSRTRKEQIR